MYICIHTYIYIFIFFFILNSPDFLQFDCPREKDSESICHEKAWNTVTPFAARPVLPKTHANDTMSKYPGLVCDRFYTSRFVHIFFAMSGQLSLN